MATIVYETPDGVTEQSVAAGKISDSGKVRGVRIKLDDGSYRHVPYTRLYSIAESEEEGQVGQSAP